MLKRYQYIDRIGDIVWTDWFPCQDCSEQEQLKGKLLNEYKNEESPRNT